MNLTQKILLNPKSEIQLITQYENETFSKLKTINPEL